MQIDPFATRPHFQKLTVHVGEIVLAWQSDTILSVHGLGSCVAVAVVQPQIQLVGLAHIQLPQSFHSNPKIDNYAVAEHALNKIEEEFRNRNATLNQCQICLVGGAQMRSPADELFIGQSNVRAVRNWFERRGLAPDIEVLGGSDWRSLSIVVRPFEIWLRSPAGWRSLFQ